MTRSLHRSGIWAALLALFFCASCGAHANGPLAKQGRIALSPQESQTIVKLAGGWEFYWHRLLTPADFRVSLPPRPDGFLELPGTWNDFKIAGKPIGSKGYATLRLRVDAGAEKRQLAMRLFHIASAYRLWIDGRLTATNGVVGRNVENEVVVPNDRVVTFQSNGRPLELVLQISNFRARNGGARMPIEFGPEGLLHEEFLRSTTLELFLCGGLFIMGLYNIVRFLFSPKERSSFYFGLLCLLWMVFTLTIPGDGNWLALYFPDRVSEVLNRAEWLIFYLTFPVGYAFLRAHYPRKISSKLFRVIVALTGLFCLEALFAPYRMLSHTAIVSGLGGGALVAYFIYVQAKAILEEKNRTGLIFVFIGTICVDVGGINDFLFDLQVIQTGQIIPYGMFAFALFQMFYLSSNTARNYREIEELSQVLDSKNTVLRTKIAESEQLRRQIVNVSEEERCRISQALHDGICQQLTAARLRFAVLKKRMLLSDFDKQEVDEMSVLLDGAVNSAYDMSIGLWPINEGTGRLAESLGELCDRAAKINHIDVEFHAAVPECRYQVPQLSEQLYKITQEALTNAIKHARAEHIQVSLTCSPEDGIRLMVDDDGVGRQAATSERGAGLGIRMMAHRAKIIGGIQTIDDREGGGTCVCCVVPCARNTTSGDCPHHKETVHV